MANQTTPRIQMNLTPTLILMEGSTAGKIGYRIKQMIHQHYGDVPVIRFLWVDTDVTIPNGAENWFSQDERAELVGYNANTVLQNLDRYPAINKWWPKNADIHAGTITRGAAQQMRLIGRLSLFRMFTEATNGLSFLSKLQYAVESMHQIENIEATRAKSNDKIQFDVAEEGARVICIFSTCGGTGSSISFDLAYLSRHLLRAHNPFIMAASILPPVIDKEINDESTLMRNKIRANTYAWFKEDQYLMAHPNWYVEYPGLAPVNVASMPFDVHFVVDLVNEANNRLNEAEDIYKMISQAIFLDTGTAIAGENSSFFTNVSVLDNYELGRRQAYSSIASASITYPSKRLQKYCGYRFAEDMLQSGLLGEPQRELVNTSIAATIAELGLRDDALIRSLREPRGVELLKKPAILRSETVNQAKQLLETQLREMDHLLESEKELVEKSGDEIYAQRSTALESRIVTMLVNYGLNNADTMVQTLRSPDSVPEDAEITSLVQLQNRISMNGITQNKINDAREELDQAMTLLSELGGNLLRNAQQTVMRKQWDQTFLDRKRDCLNKLEQYIDSKLMYETQQTAKDIFSRLLTFLQAKLKEIKAIEQTISKIKGALSQEAEDSLQPEIAAEGIFELKREILGDKKYFTAFYQRQSKMLLPSTIYQIYAEKLSYHNLSVVKKWAEDRLIEELVQHAKNQFSDAIASTSLLDALNNHYGKDAPEKIGDLMDDLLTYCSPFWQFERDRGELDQEGKSIIGIEDSQSQLIPDRFRLNRKFNLVSTGFKHSIDVVRVKHGIPAFLLKDMDEYKAMYELVRSKTKDPLHIFANAQELDDIFPDEHKESRQLFALGLAFNFIVQIGSFYYFDLNRDYTGELEIKPTPEFRLDQGRGNAEEALIHKPEFLDPLAQKIENLIEDLGTKATIENIEEAITKLKIHISKLPPNNEDMRPQLSKEVTYLRAYQRMLGAIVDDF
jgi:hypothetical protein